MVKHGVNWLFNTGMMSQHGEGKKHKTKVQASDRKMKRKHKQCLTAPGSMVRKKGSVTAVRW